MAVDREFEYVIWASDQDRGPLPTLLVLGPWASSQDHRRRAAVDFKKAQEYNENQAFPTKMHVSTMKMTHACQNVFVLDGPSSKNTSKICLFLIVRPVKIRQKCVCS